MWIRAGSFVYATIFRGVIGYSDDIWLWEQGAAVDNLRDKFRINRLR